MDNQQLRRFQLVENFEKARNNLVNASSVLKQAKIAIDEFDKMINKQLEVSEVTELVSSGAD